MSGADTAKEDISKRKVKKEKKLEAIKAAKKAFQSVDGQVQHTNDDSVVSKRSAVIHGYIQDPFLRLFVKSKARRSPLINRGYYLRMRVITNIVSQAIDLIHKNGSSGSPIQVISLGAGYDTFALRCLLASERKDFYESNVQFYDVDFDAVMKSKSILLQAAPEGTIPQNWVRQPTLDNGNSTYIQSPCYRALGVDLREAESELITKLQRSNPLFSVDHPTIVYAECVMQYMPDSAALSLLQLLAKEFSTMVFFAYDQLHADDSFGKVMEQSLKMRNSPLLGVRACGNGTQMIKRALKAGMKAASFANFYDLSRYYIDNVEEENHRLSALEPFDEIEEWSEMCEHYGITMGCTRIGLIQDDWHPCFVGSKYPNPPLKSSTIGVVECLSQHWPSGRFRFERWGFGDMCCQSLPDGDTVFIAFGGFSAGKVHSRVNTIFCHSLRRGDLDVVVTSSVTPGPLIFHSFSKVSSNQFVVFGGRTSPTEVFDNTYLLTLIGLEDSSQSIISARWDLLSVEGTTKPTPRFRHAATFCPQSGQSENGTLFVFGGSSSHGSFLGDAWIGTLLLNRKEIQWKMVPLHKDTPSPCCSASALYYEKYVILSGGLKEGFDASDAVTRIDIISGECLRSEHRIGKRYSHSSVITTLKHKDYIFILGGSFCDPKENNISALLLDPKELSLTSHVRMPQDSFSWSRHSCVSMSDGVIAVVGGGYTCFSFGTATVRPLLLLLDGAEFNPTSQATSDAKLSLEQMFFNVNSQKMENRVVEKELTPDSFLATVTAATVPVLFKDVSFGSCRSEWRHPQYLSDAEKDSTVSVHVATGTCVLDFVNKNFSFRHVSFSELINHTVAATQYYREKGKVPDEIYYFRSISSHMKTDRANIWKDFPRIGKDFCLPDFVQEFILPRIHQACWRINSFPMTLWMHYDTLDNVLCQIVGRKKVTLFPPSQYNNLYMVDSSSQVLSMSNPNLERFPRFIEASKHKMEVVLEPGDMIFIPALWFHHIETIESADDDYSISVNVFYEHFDSSMYDKKDLYGNKDIPRFAALRSSIVAHANELVSLSAGTPPSKSGIKYTEFALREAIQDLESLANSLGAKGKSFE